MRIERIKTGIRSLPEVAAWPQMIDLVDRAVHREWRSIWEYPVAACLAVGGDEEAALPAAAAVFCSMTSIHLVDDMLDEDPLGDYRRIGSGIAANLALAFQAAGHRLLDDPAVAPAIRAALQAKLGGMALATAFGQNLDARPLSTEEEYWRILEARTPPLIGTALHMGALLGGATAEAAEGLEEIGRVMGRFIQVSDDLSDALSAPAGADWQRRSHNLALLYAMTAEHAEQSEFLHLSTRAADPAALAAAQTILLRCGAVSYCTLRMLEFAQDARERLSRLEVADRAPIERLLEIQAVPLFHLLQSVGVEEPVLTFEGG